MTHTDNSGEEGSLGLTADKRAEEYISKQQAARRAELESSKLDPEVAEGIDDFFDGFARVYVGDSEFDEAFGPKNKTYPSSIVEQANQVT